MAVMLAISIFLVCYFFIIIGKVNQALVAMTGAILLMITHVYSWEEAFRWAIDWDTIALLFAMMVIVAITEKTGLFQYIAISLVQLVKGQPILLLLGSSLLMAVGAALLDNVTAVLLFVPIILSITKRLELPAFPYLLIVIFSANIGGTATIIGDPPNIMIGQAVEHFDFLDFILHLGPVVLIMLVIANIFMVLLFRKQLTVKPYLVNQLLSQNAADYIVNKSMMHKCTIILSITMIGFLSHAFIQLDLTTVSVSAAVLLLLLTEKDLAVTKVFAEVEWDTLFFFIALYTLVGALKEVGVLEFVSQYLISLTRGDLVLTAISVLWVSGLLSQFINNAPFVAAMVPVIQEFQTYGMDYLDPIWWALALGACLGGNGSLIGTTANVVVAGLAEADNEKISFTGYMKFGVPLVLLSLFVSTVYILLRYLLPIL
ncbi:possible tyrosine transporter P-protein (TC 2.A.45.2.1) [Amphibacillus marinus]|uniref:Possible tyrosine transporter P-protein (TC 2.A.45.2.1) n=1 Tax=Amphibacillus marinus TaxID=872970 RepID=A0A1H8NZT3_9BACI|nr:ArsB/NhaD family transporter [Amphibacillus marinus]SEO35117.1 possible tyrosine transporter P-protein (TC 2.A.45.2.1) [Amphibacillus marinus]